MTLSICSLLSNMIRKEASIQHFNCQVDVGHAKSIKSNVKSAISEQYGESFIYDADIIAFFKCNDGWNESSIKQLFNLVNRALGKSANDMTKDDFKLLKGTDEFNSGFSSSVSEDDEDADQEEQVDKVVFMKITTK